MPVQPASRRSFVSGLVVVAASGVAGFVLARNSDAAKAKRSTTAANAYGPAPAAAGHLLVRLDAVPAGGGVILDAADVVVTRDPAGAVHAFSATCTHQGCTVVSVQDGTISCPCHGSQFDAATGAPRRGPATRPLPTVAVVTRDGGVYTT